MPELALHDRHNTRFRSSYGGAIAGGGAGRDASPDSVMYRFESSFNLISSSASASASVERCSSPSDVIDHDSLVSDLSPHSSSGGYRVSDPDPKRNAKVRNNGGPYLLGQKVDKAEETDADSQTIYSARSSFSYKECQNRKTRSETLLTKSDRRRPMSLDLNSQTMSVTSLSPRLGSVKTSSSARRRGVFPSPVTPNYHIPGFGVQKGWSSERVPLNTSGKKALPSKWEDAERWIISPVAVEQQKRVKSKSGPLGPHGSACYSVYSPAGNNFERRDVKSFVSESPVLSGGNAEYSSLIQYQNGNVSSLMDHYIARSVSLHGCSEMLSHSLLQITQDDKTVGSNSIDASTTISHDVSRRDMATQMSPDSSLCSSPRRTTSNSILAVDLQHTRSSKSDIRDVQVDDQVTLTPFTKKLKGQNPGSGSNTVDDWKSEGSEMRTSRSKVQREEAKITAWENLQKAKADAAIRKLEMKLEKKRSSSMDRIIHKLQSAQKKAEEMRESVLSEQPHRVAKSSHKAISLIKTRHVRFLTGCFTCPAF